jgi:hypothetical protein
MTFHIADTASDVLGAALSEGIDETSELPAA